MCSDIRQPQSVTVYFEMIRAGRLYEMIDRVQRRKLKVREGMMWSIWFIGENNLVRVVDVVQVFVENQRRRGREPMRQFLELEARKGYY